MTDCFTIKVRKENLGEMEVLKEQIERHGITASSLFNSIIPYLGAALQNAEAKATPIINLNCGKILIK